MGANTSDPEAEARLAVNALRAIVQALRTSSSRVQSAHRVSGAQMFVLQQLASGPAASLNELAARTLTHQSSASVVVSRLERQGLVVRKRSTEDARRTLIVVTPRGLKLLAKADPMPQAKLVAAVRALDARRRRELGKTLAQLAGAMGLRDERAPLFFERKPDGG
jgi:DNA-binding MarR family transcriptional regulator